MRAVSTTLGWRLVNGRMRPEWTLSLGECNERLGDRFGIDRVRQDEFAVRSHALAGAAWDAGFYDDFVLGTGAGDTVDAARPRDEGFRSDAGLEKLARLRTSFRSTEQGGTITAGNASPLSDGASALLLGSREAAGMIGAEPLAQSRWRGSLVVAPRRWSRLNSAMRPSRRPTVRAESCRDPLA